MSEEALKAWGQLVLVLGNQLQQAGLKDFQPSFVKRMSAGMTARTKLFGFDMKSYSGFPFYFFFF